MIKSFLPIDSLASISLAPTDPDDLINCLMFSMFAKVFGIFFMNALTLFANAVYDPQGHMVLNLSL